jgi:hypothetical protein
MNQEELGYAIARILAENEMPEVLEILAEHCGIRSERVDSELDKKAYLKAMDQIFATAKLLTRN